MGGTGIFQVATGKSWNGTYPCNYCPGGHRLYRQVQIPERCESLNLSRIVLMTLYRVFLRLWLSEKIHAISVYLN